MTVFIEKLGAGAASLLLLLQCAVAADISPQSLRHYQLLEQALVRYRALALQPELTDLPPLPVRSIRPGEPYTGAESLRRLLIAVGDLALPAASGEISTLNVDLVEGLTRFQQRHGLETDGILGPATWRDLTTPFAQRVSQIELTLERWRQLPPNPWPRAIFINIPQFRLIALHTMDESEAQMLRMNVVVGQPLERLRTPTFVSDMTHLIFRPYWDVPWSIAARELIPQIRTRPGYMETNHFEIVSPSGQVVEPTPARLDAVAAGSLRLRQRPGPDNALGRVKFVMPNSHSVYLHDTPAQSLFSRSRRAFSHGCVRVADPLALAEYVLQGDPAWTRADIEQAMNGSGPLRVNLSQPIRVYIAYGTAIARENGEVLFFEDLYGLDAAQPLQNRTRPVSR